MATGNGYLLESFWPRMNRRFGVEARERGNAFVALGDAALDDVLCLKEERTVTRDNCVSYRGVPLQLPVDHGRHYVKRQVRVHEHADGTLSVFHGPAAAGALRRRRRGAAGTGGAGGGLGHVRRERHGLRRVKRPAKPPSRRGCSASLRPSG